MIQTKKVLKIAAISGVLAIAMGASCQNAADTVGSMGIGGSHASEVAGYAGAGLTAADAMTIDEKGEENIGQSLGVKVTYSPGIVANNKLNEYVTLVGLTVASVCPRSDIDFTFGVLDTDQVNALSGPHGYVFITRGALMQMHDESELAGVIAHEIGHIVKQDGLHAIQKSGLMKAGAQAVSVNHNDQITQMLTGTSDKLVTVVYDQGQEKSADKQAVKYLKAAGYDPRGYANFLERINSKGSGFFKSHPPTADRVAAIRKAIGDSTGGATLADRFHIDTGF